MHLPNETKLAAELWYEALEHLLQLSPSQSAPAVVGAAAGVLHQAGRLSADELQQLLRGYLLGTSNDSVELTGCLRGVLSVVPELLWQSPAWLAFFDELFGQLPEDRFLHVLPELRLAFAQLSPRELSRIAGQVESLHMHADDRTAQPPTAGTALETDLAQQLTALVQQTLQRDHLLFQPE